MSYCVSKALIEKLKLDDGNTWYCYRMGVAEFAALTHNFKAYHFLDFDKIKLPLKLRRRETGDYFYPFGMKGKKKLKKYFTDQKYNIFQKEDAWILESDDGIIAILGDRIDERFKVEESTKEVLLLVKVK